MIKQLTLVAAFGLILSPALGQDYSNQAQITQRVKALESANGSLVKLRSLTKTAGGKDIWELEIGVGDRANHPAVAVMGGVEGPHL